MQRSLGGTLIRNLGRNLIAGLRLALFLRVSPLSFRALPGDCAALVIFNLIAWLLGDIAREGVPGQLNLAALPVQLMQVPVLLFLAVLVAGVYRRRDLILLITVMWISADWLFELAATAIRWLTPFADLPGVGMPLFYIVYGTMAWGLLVMLRAVWLALGLRIPRFVTASVLVALTYAGFYYLMPRAQIWVPDGPDAGAESGNSIASEQIFHLQPALFADALDNLLPQRPGISDLYFVGVAPYGKEDVFLREMLSARSILEDRFDVDGRSVTLINNAKTLDSTPIATTTNLRATLGYLGELMDPEEDVLLLFLTSHGERNHELAFSLPPLDLQQLTPSGLARMLGESKIKWKVLVVSACFSGGFVDPLRDENTLIITASDATSSSFGCAHENEWTYFGRAFFEAGMQKSFSFENAFETARSTVGTWEARDGLKASNPQLHVGDAIRKMLPELERRLERRKADPHKPRLEARYRSRNQAQKSRPINISNNDTTIVVVNGR